MYTVIVGTFPTGRRIMFLNRGVYLVRPND